MNAQEAMDCGRECHRVLQAGRPHPFVWVSAEVVKRGQVPAWMVHERGTHILLTCIACQDELAILLRPARQVKMGIVLTLLRTLSQDTGTILEAAGDARYGGWRVVWPPETLGSWQVVPTETGRFVMCPGCTAVHYEQMGI